MNNFEDLQNKWQNQTIVSATEKGFDALLKNIKTIEQRQRIMNVVLCATIFILIGFSIYVNGYTNTTFSLGIGLMISSLIFRIAIEIYSLQRSRKLNFIKDATSFKNDLTRYFGFRKIVHFLITPLAICVYAIGFIILLPLFKASLSYGFYLYVLISSVVFLLVFSVFIFKQIQNELNKLKQLLIKD